MGWLGISANLMSFGGLAIAIGMMVDGTIVMVENVDRHLREAPPEASRSRVVSRACAEVARPIAFAVSIIVIVFLPLFTLEGVEGKTFRPLAYTVALAMAGSLVFAIALAPVASDLLLRRPEGPAREVRVVRFLLRFYRPAVSFFVQRRPLAAFTALGLLVLGALCFPLLGSEFTPRLQEGTLVVRLSMAPSISLVESARVAGIVERRLMSVPEIEGVVTRIGRGEVGAHTDPVNSAEMLVLLRPEAEWESARSQEELEAAIRERLGVVPGVLVNFTQPIAMTVDELLEGVRAELAIKIFGDDLGVLAGLAADVARVITQVPGAADVQVDQVDGAPQLVIRVDRQAVARYGLNVADVQRTVRAAIGGETAGEIFEGIRRFPIYVRFAAEYRETPRDVENVLIAAPDGARVLLSEVATIEEVVGPRQVTREDNQRFITIQCNVVGRDIGGFVADAQAAIDAGVVLPAGHLVTWGGQFRLQQEANRRLAVVVPLTLLAVLLMLYASFGSLRGAGLILLNIPLALVGGVVALAVSSQNLSVPAAVGFIALLGIALENGMVLVTCLDQLVADGVPIDEASVRGAGLRLRPVLMTAVTTGLGLLPLLFSTGTGSEVQRPLATVVVGGLATSTLLTLLVLPALYEWFAPPRPASRVGADPGPR
jgi:cobalt-zinc-cadmium resistance protein CzcA